MKLIKKLFSFIVVLCLFSSMLPAAFAQEDSRFEGRSWDEVVGDLFAAYSLNPEQVTLGYYNTVTGEEHYHQPDKYMIGGSVYKVPLNMAFAEKIYNGEMDWETPTPYLKYESMMRESIIYSSNDVSGTLMIQLAGGYYGFLDYIAPYLGVDTATVDPNYYNERFTARQYVSCLKTLYHESERFPKIIETMLEAEPENYFRYTERRYDIAHKYGWWQENWTLCINDVGIVYTDDPIVIVCFTAGLGNAYQFLSDYCTLMCDYTQYHREKRLEAEAEEAARVQAALEQARKEAEEKEIVSQSIEAVPALEADSAPAVSPLLIFAAIAITAFVALVLVFIFVKRSSSRLWACTAVLICTAAALLCLLAGSMGTVFAKPKGEPQQTVTAFFDALKAGDYNSAYSHISGYSSLGLENTPTDAVSKTVYDKLKASYSYELSGSCSVDKLSASQQLQFTYLNLPSIREDVNAACFDRLEDIVMERSKAEVYDENNNFLPAVTNEAFEYAVNEVLKDADKYSVTESLQLELEYKDGRWLIVPDAAFIAALSGGIAN